MGLNYQAFGFVETILTGLLPGVVPHSGKKYALMALWYSYQFIPLTNYSRRYAASGVVGQTTKGTPMFTTNYPESKIQRFDLQSFYFACVLNTANGATAVPTPCNIQITGYQGSDNSVSNAKQVCSQQFQYNPTTILGSQQQAFSRQVNNCFKNLQFAIVTYTLPGGLSAANAALAILLDDIKYTTYTCKK
jgi:hypothetical protein